MTEKGTKTLIGFFVMCALTLLIGGVMIVGSGSFSSAARFVCFFDASLRGLLPGSPVYFRGVRVGKVVSIQINADADELTFRTPVVIELEKSALKSSLTELSRQATELARELTAQSRGLTEVREQAVATMERYGELAARMEKSAQDISGMGVSARLTMDSLRLLVREDSAPLVEFSQTMRALRDAADSINNLATLLELKPDALIFGRRR